MGATQRQRHCILLCGLLLMVSLWICQQAPTCPPVQTLCCVRSYFLSHNSHSGFGFLTHSCLRACSVVKTCLTLQSHGLRPTRLLCLWDSLGKNTGMGSHSFFQGIFQAQGSNPHLLCLLHWQEDSLPLSHQGSPLCKVSFPVP